MKKNDGGFRHCHGENIQVYTADSRTRLGAVRNLVRGLRKLEKEDGVDCSVYTITVTHYEAAGVYWYDAVAYVAGDIW